MAVTREAIIALYRNLIRETKKWDSYNYRMYALRKIRWEFRERLRLTDATEVKECYDSGRDSLNMIKRQVLLGNLYSDRPLVIETKQQARAAE